MRPFKKILRAFIISAFSICVWSSAWAQEFTATQLIAGQMPWESLRVDTGINSTLDFALSANNRFYVVKSGSDLSLFSNTFVIRDISDRLGDGFFRLHYHNSNYQQFLILDNGNPVELTPTPSSNFYLMQDAWIVGEVAGRAHVWNPDGKGRDFHSILSNLDSTIINSRLRHRYVTRAGVEIYSGTVNRHATPWSNDTFILNRSTNSLVLLGAIDNRLTRASVRNITSDRNGRVLISGIFEDETTSSWRYDGFFFDLQSAALTVLPHLAGTNNVSPFSAMETFANGKVLIIGAVAPQSCTVGQLCYRFVRWKMSWNAQSNTYVLSAPVAEILPLTSSQQTLYADRDFPITHSTINKQSGCFVASLNTQSTQTLNRPFLICPSAG